MSGPFLTTLRAAKLKPGTALQPQARSGNDAFDLVRLAQARKRHGSAMDSGHLHGAIALGVIFAAGAVLVASILLRP